MLLSPKTKAILWMLVGCAALTLAMAFAQVVKPVIGIYNVILTRAFVGCMVVVITAIVRKINPFAIKTPWLNILSVGFILSSTICTYVAYTNLPLCLAVTIGFTGPIINIMLAMMILGERVYWYQWLAIILCFLGVIIETRPDAYGFNIYVIVDLIANILAGLAVLIIKKVVINEQPVRLWVFNGVVQSILYLAIFIVIIMLGKGSCFTIESGILKPQVIFQVIMMGSFGVASQYARMRALKIAKISTLAPVEYSRIIFAIPLDFIILGMLPTTWALIGAAIIITANLVSILLSKKV